MNIPYFCLADTGELTDDPPDLAAGVDEDLHLVFGELLLSLGTQCLFEILCLVAVTFRSGLNIDIFLRGIAEMFIRDSYL